MAPDIPGWFGWATVVTLLGYVALVALAIAVAGWEAGKRWPPVRHLAPIAVAGAACAANVAQAPRSYDWRWPVAIWMATGGVVSAVRLLRELGGRGGPRGGGPRP
jgi:hypothetical protein